LVIVFSSGAVASVIRTLPMVARANLAVENLERLERELEEQHRVVQDAEVQDRSALTERLEARGITYAYRDPEGGIAFSLGPCDFEVKAGETVFIVGGNGSGKSTLIKLLTYLYEPAAGTIFWDGTPVTNANAEAYRGLFSVIFSDFHLFDRLYGIETQDQSEVERLLETMRLGDRVAYRDGRFIKTELSTGQRKRLAMVVARLENRPVCIFDEWAADQDPEYRKYYYETLLPQLKAEGRTIIASTHDDRYFHVADKVIWMEEGRIERIETGA
jgi:putative ATP-binding cassette transporter